MSISIYSILSSIPHNPHYLNRYIKFIEGCKQKNVDIEGYVERHHICPKCLFSKYKNLNHHEWNSAILTARQHFIAHHMLWKIYPKSNLCFAFFSMCNHKDYMITSIVYENLKQQYSINNKGKKHSEEAKKKMSKNHADVSGENNPMYGSSRYGEENPFFGRKHSEEAKKKMSKNRARLWGEDNPNFGKTGVNCPWFGRKHSEEAKKKISLSKKGKKKGPMSEEQKQKIRESSKGENAFECPHCGKRVGKGNYTRWHGDNCKFKK